VGGDQLPQREQIKNARSDESRTEAHCEVIDEPQNRLRKVQVSRSCLFVDFDQADCHEYRSESFLGREMGRDHHRDPYDISKARQP